MRRVRNTQTVVHFGVTQTDATNRHQRWTSQANILKADKKHMRSPNLEHKGLEVDQPLELRRVEGGARQVHHRKDGCLLLHRLKHPDQPKEVLLRSCHARGDRHTRRSIVIINHVGKQVYNPFPLPQPMRPHTRVLIGDNHLNDGVECLPDAWQQRGGPRRVHKRRHQHQDLADQTPLRLPWRSKGYKRERSRGWLCGWLKGWKESGLVARV